jgi:hypothetical protein
VGTCWHHFGESQIGLAQKAFELFLRSFLTSKTEEHDVVQKLSRMEFVPCRYDRLDQQQPAFFTHSLPPGVQNPPFGICDNQGPSITKELSMALGVSEGVMLPTSDKFGAGGNRLTAD